MLTVMVLVSAIVNAMGGPSAYSTAAYKAKAELMKHFTEPSFSDEKYLLSCMMDPEASECFGSIGYGKLIETSRNGLLRQKMNGIFSDQEVVEQARILKASNPDLFDEHSALMSTAVTKFGVPVCAAPDTNSIHRDLKKRNGYGIGALALGCAAVVFLTPGLVLAIHFGKIALGALATGIGASHLISEFFWFALGLSLSIDGAALAISSACVGCFSCCFD
eukprot:NODE_105_length_19900_cov_0.306550.p7 type:complete len:220 gc:universal NODE_105_length_19900_cov_0.306550:18455-19114(+)